MSFVEGIGDEVFQTLICFFVILVCIVAWRSTAIRDLPPIRTVLILERRSGSTTTNNANRNRQQNSQSDTGQRNPPDATSNETNDVCPQNEASTSLNSTEGGGQASVLVNEINAKRLSYFTNLRKNNVEINENDETPTNQESIEEEDINVLNDEDSRFIRVKLKYFNDDIRIVRGNPQELLGEFKRRYFEAELSDNKSVLLIFKGKVLAEEDTLQTLGMYDNCVVHCLVKNRVGNQSGGGGVGGAAANRGSSHQPNVPTIPAEWNLSSVLCSSLCIILSFSWFAYIHYSHLFAVTTTSILVCSTALFLVSVVAMYFPDLLPS